MRSRALLIVLLAVATVGTTVVVAQLGRPYRMHRSLQRSDYPDWQIDDDFPDDVFTFVRIKYSSTGYRRGSNWDNDFPDSDWNFSYRLQELTSLEVDPVGRTLRLTDPKLTDYPFIYMNGVGHICLSDAEVTALRNYLLSGGFMMADDFWGHTEWLNLYNEMKRVFPDREPVDLSLDHEIFRMVYVLDEMPQVPDIRTWRSGETYEYRHAGLVLDKGPHFRGFLDDNQRLVALLCHNNDLGDGWEREGEDVEYFRRFSEKLSYPMGINIITYAMTH